MSRSTRSSFPIDALARDTSGKVKGTCGCSNHDLWAGDGVHEVIRFQDKKRQKINATSQE